MKLRVLFDKDAYLSHDVANLTVELDNSENKRDVTDIRIFLTQITDLKTHSGQKHSNSETLQTIRLNGVKAGEKKEGQQAYQTKLKIAPKDNFQATSNGELIKNYFRISITTNVDATNCCGSNDCSGH